MTKDKKIQARNMTVVLVFGLVGLVANLARVALDPSVNAFVASAAFSLCVVAASFRLAELKGWIG